MFRDRSDLLADATPLRGTGAAVTPGRDGPLVFLAGYGEQNRLYARKGDRYVDTATGIVADGDRHAVTVAAADLDADGCEELYVHNASPDARHGYSADADMLLGRLERERYRWTDAFTLPVNGERCNYRVGGAVAVLDRYGTGRYGAVVAGDETATRFYELGDDSEVTDMAEAIGVTVETTVTALLTGPIVSDRMDLFVGVDGGPNRLFRNEAGHFMDVAPEHGPCRDTVPANGATLLDERGRFSLVLGCRSEGLRRFRGNREDRLAEATPEPFSRPADVRTVIAADFDNDGSQELFCATGDGRNVLFGGASPTERWSEREVGEAARPADASAGAVVADLDGDGILELLLLGGAEPTPPVALSATGADGNGWLRVRPTTQYAAPARGALVTLETDAGTQRRVIDAGCGSRCQSEPVAHFGLGEATPRQLTVSWPDGRRRVVTDVTARSEVNVAHPVAPRF